MPYRHAHLFVLLLFPITWVAFWRGYFSDLAGAPFALHAHGITASFWLALLAFQSWTIHAKRSALHRAAGLGVFAVVPLFAAGGLLAMQAMSAKFAGAADPFNGTFGARLGIVDAVATLGLLALVSAALARRRQVRLHAGYMLATVLLLLSPIIARLFPLVPGFPFGLVEGQHPFEEAFHVAQLAGIAISLALYRSRPRDGAPFLTAAGLVAVQSVLFETVGRAAAWERLFVGLVDIHPSLLAAVGLAVGGSALWAGWGRVSGAPRVARPA